MTEVRREVVAVLSHLDGPYSAYQILSEVNKKRDKKLSAMSLYRTLDFLIDLGVVIKLESQNAYRLCGLHGADHSHLLIICDHCGSMKEVADAAASKTLRQLVNRHGHTLKHHVVELHGLCASCKNRSVA